MKQYFLHDGQNKIGPLSVEELKERNITGETFVWKEGLDDWVKATEIEELRILLTNTPPPFKATLASNPSPTIAQSLNQSGSYKAGNWIGRNWKLFVLLCFVGVIAIIIIYNNVSPSANIYDPPNPSSTEKTPEQLRSELAMKEKENPLDYLKANITRRKNLLGENVFEGTITSTASVAKFKDITVKITYLSKTRSVIRSDKFIVYKEISPKQNIDIEKVKLLAPNETDEYTVDIVSAIPEN